MAVYLSPIGGAASQFFDDSGVPLSGGKIFTYNAGTTTPLTTYTTVNGNIQHTNPIILDAAGRVPSGEIWLTLGIGYKFVITTSNDVLIGTFDNIPSSAQPPAANDADSIMYEQGYTVTAGGFVTGSMYRILSVGNTDFTLIGAASNTVGLHFIATGAGSGTGTAEFSQTVETKFRQVINVQDFGASPSATASVNNIGIAAAITYCSANNKTLYFPSGIYLVSTTFSNVGCSMSGEPNQTTIRNTNTSTLGNLSPFFFLFQNTPNLVVRNMIFDGQVSAVQNTYNQDPVSWNSGNYNTFYGPRGPQFYGCDFLQVENCQFLNFFNNGLRINYCGDHRVTNCITSRNRGQFGDGFYTTASSRCSYIGCYAYDFTRIGFVTEGEDGNASTYFKFVNCFAKYGHDRAILYGGTEYNAGFWYENSVEIETHNCVAIDTGFGFVAAAGASTTNNYDSPSAPYAMNYVGCRSTENYEGFKVGSLVGNVNAIISNCVVTISESAAAGSVGIILNMQQNSTAIVDGCVITSPATNTNTMKLVSLYANAPTGQQPKYTISNCNIGHLNASACATLLTQLGSEYRGDITQEFNGSTAYNLKVENCQSIAANGFLVVNQLAAVSKPSGQTQTCQFVGPNSKLYVYLTGSQALDEILVNGADGYYFYAAYGSTINLQNSTFANGAFMAFSNGYSAQNNEIRNCRFYGQVQAWGQYTIPNSGSIVAAFRDCVFKSSLTANGSQLLDIRNNSTVGNRCQFVIDQCTFINTGSNGSNSAAITSPYNDFMYTTAKTTNYFDTTITNVAVNNLGFGPASIVTDPTANSYGIRVTYTV